MFAFNIVGGGTHDHLRARCSQMAARTTRDKTRQNAIVNALMRKALQWRRQ